MRNKDFAEKQTDKMIDELEEKIAKIYAQAQKELEEKYLKYSKAFQIEDEKRRKELQENYTDENVEKYNNWRKNKFFTEKRYKEMFEVLSEDLAKVDQKAMSIANGFLPEAYALNFNYETYDMEQNTQLNTSFTLYSRETVERLEKGGRKLLPKRKVDIPKDKIWNLKHLRNEITQGVLQGKSIPNIAKSLQKVTDMDRRAAVRNARTMMTGAQNGGRLDAMKRAKDLGIRVQKEWVATLDSRTRDSHAELDGKRVALDSYFPNGCQCPGDPNGAPEEVYNCRCTMVAFYPDYQDIMQKRITYKEWAESRRDEVKNKSKEKSKYEYDHRQWVNEIYGNKYDENEKEEIAKAYSEAPEELQKLYEKYGSKLFSLTDTNGGSYFNNGKGITVVNITKDKMPTSSSGIHSKFGTSAHELGHNMDYLAGGKNPASYLSQKYVDKEKNMSFKDIIFDDWDNYFMQKTEGVKVYTKYEDVFSKIVGRSTKKAKKFLREIEGRILPNFDVDPSKEWEPERQRLSFLYNKYKEQIRKIEPIKMSDYKSIIADNKELFEQFMPKKYLVIDGEVLDDFCTEIKSKYTMNQRGNLGDMFERYCVEHGGRDYPFGVGHGSKFAITSGMLETEAFAEMTDSTVFTHESLELIKEYLPQSYKAFLDMIKKEVEQ